jgi:AraC-like DNA-binding protein/mannose-6-phosphate isomerase-like protein (cupin superfamily)
MCALSTNDYLIDIDKHPSTIFVLHERTERRFPIHMHVKGQLTYVQGGIAYVHVEAKIYVIPARHYIWIPAGLPHFLQVKNSGSVIRTLYFPMAQENDAFYQKMGIYPVNKLLHEMLLYTEKFQGQMKPDDSRFCLFVAIKNLLPELGITHLQTALPTSQHLRLKPVLAFLYSHVSEQITLHNISEQFGFSERSLSRLFQSELSISFLQYVKQIRMVKAVELMLQTNLTLSEIAYATGYFSISAFSNTFYQFTNMRPSQFTKTVR